MNVDKQPFTDEEHNQLIKAVFNEVGTPSLTAQNPVILTTTGIRQRLRHLIEKEFPQLAVLGYQELEPYVNVQPIARISWN